ncbi:hypothetical protein KDN34_14230 [Shewanella yunxiaonensis]|uniref:DUF6868 domain-containing protein n=1 Tax=Shewanella yunxiaonensis TaxID=2829809 RepID=A0ABX7YRD7_9GAMM|nr:MULTISPECIES: hypothetical protein [Shewanella]MDF0535864.1 hypothetical protein [Shewanella sp. A32]QUN05340.1 hypothetical protein KDN34_14230 [Shewanella yunxiaonensis]
MSLEQITALFQWMALINIGLLSLSAVLAAAFKPLLFKLHGQLFGLEPRQISAVIYGFLGFYKVLILVFNLVPYLAMLIVSNY